MLVYPSGVEVFSSALRFLAARLRERRRALGTRWRRQNAGPTGPAHKKHGMNMQVIADLKVLPLRASPALAGAVHDVQAAREHGIIDALAEASSNCWADKGYQGAGDTVPLYRSRWDSLSAGQQAVNRSHANTRRFGHWSSRPSPPSSPDGS